MERTAGREIGLKRAFALTFAVLLVELAGGLASHSLALLSDAGHVLIDVFALGLAWFAVQQAGRPADRRRSYGYQRATILAALLNSAALVVIVLAIGYEAVRRLAAPQPVQGGIVVVAALMALSAHVVVDDCPLGDAEHLVRDLEQRLCDRFSIGHTTIQVESCHPCGDIEHGAGAHNHPHEHLIVTSSARPRAAGSGEPAR